MAFACGRSYEDLDSRNRRSVRAVLDGGGCHASYEVGHGKGGVMKYLLKTGVFMVLFMALFTLANHYGSAFDGWMCGVTFMGTWGIVDSEIDLHYRRKHG